MPRKAKVGDLVEVTWADAVFYTDLADVDDETLKNGGEICFTTGYVIAYDSKVIVLAAELSDEREPMRDINIIPIGMVKRVKVLTKGRFGV